MRLNHQPSLIFRKEKRKRKYVDLLNWLQKEEEEEEGEEDQSAIEANNVRPGRRPRSQGYLAASDAGKPKEPSRFWTTFSKAAVIPARRRACLLFSKVNSPFPPSAAWFGPRICFCEDLYKVCLRKHRLGAGHPRLAEPGPQGGARLTSHHGKRTAQESAEDGRAEPVLPGSGSTPGRLQPTEASLRIITFSPTSPRPGAPGLAEGRSQQRRQVHRFPVVTSRA
ncbi:uncharacterized protein LOC121481003 [Vulpes lagopus]|uniref:uncharacterized protein LOC121481003 n=1 Tax=Vulpes lagopus TaxID=494514 RepID=UPI001BC8DA77|nr:uncharacterized protein LOC121481003 [Vulpes lagopus]